jgi:hypothetical protein
MRRGTTIAMAILLLAIMVAGTLQFVFLAK